MPRAKMFVTVAFQAGSAWGLMVVVTSLLYLKRGSFPRAQVGRSCGRGRAGYAMLLFCRNGKGTTEVIPTANPAYHLGNLGHCQDVEHRNRGIIPLTLTHAASVWPALGCGSVSKTFDGQGFTLEAVNLELGSGSNICYSSAA